MPLTATALPRGGSAEGLLWGSENTVSKTNLGGCSHKQAIIILLAEQSLSLSQSTVKLDNVHA